MKGVPVISLLDGALLLVLLLALTWAVWRAAHQNGNSVSGARWYWSRRLPDECARVSVNNETSKREDLLRFVLATIADADMRELERVMSLSNADAVHSAALSLCDPNGVVLRAMSRLACLDVLGVPVGETPAPLCHMFACLVPGGGSKAHSSILALVLWWHAFRRAPEVAASVLRRCVELVDEQLPADPATLLVLFATRVANSLKVDDPQPKSAFPSTTDRFEAAVEQWRAHSRIVAEAQHVVDAAIAMLDNSKL
jgi:hypothetical protein